MPDDQEAPHRFGYAAQVRHAYANGEIDEQQLREDMDVAVKLDCGWWDRDVTPPEYLRDKNGFPIG